MAGTIVKEIVSKEKCEFSGTSQEDVAYAKSFWQSIQLLPPMESRLVSSNIKQRLKVVPPAHQATNHLHGHIADEPILNPAVASVKQALVIPPWRIDSYAKAIYTKDATVVELTNFLAKAKALEKLCEVERLEKFAALRDADMALLSKYREQRKQKEEASGQLAMNSRLQTQDFTQNDDFISTDCDNDVNVLQDLDKFEKSLNLNDSDSD